MKKSVLIPLTSLGLQLLFGSALAQQRPPQPGPGGVVRCITLPNGIQKCEQGNYVVPGQRPPPPYYPPQPQRPQPPPPPYYPPQPQRPQPPPPPYYPPPPPPAYYPPPPPPYNPPPSYPQPPPPPYYPGVPSYGVQQFCNDEQQVVMWNQRYNAAPSGSWDESNARQNRDQMIQRALSDLSDYRAFDGMSRQAVESLADQLTQKYNAASSGSAIEGFYNQARRLVFGSLQQVVQQELNACYDFRSMEQIAVYFTQRYNAAPSGSLEEQTFNQIRRLAFSTEVQSFQSRAYQMGPQELYQVQSEYDQKYSGAPSGSLEESTYRQIRDIARSLCGGNNGVIGSIR